MTARSREQRLGYPAIALVLLLASAPARADSAPGTVGGGTPGAVTPQVQPPAATGPEEPKPSPAVPQDAGKKAEPPPLKNLETLAPGAAIGLLGKKVRDAAGEDMGMVVDMLVDSDGRPRAAIIDFGGFLGVGSRKIAVDWRLLQIKQVDSTTSVLLSLTRAEVQAAPEYKPSSNQPVMIVGPMPPSADVPIPANAPK